MSQTRIFYPYSRSPSSLFSTIALVWINYELYRVAAGKHPYFTPKLEKAGIVRRPGNKDSTPDSSTGTKTTTSAIEQRPAAKIQWPKSEAAWTYLNGVPIPSLELLTRPFRRE